MSPDELRPILTAYRKQVESAWSEATAHKKFAAKPGDPAGQCGVTSAWLQRRLRADYGLGTVYYAGRVELNRSTIASHHCWLQNGPIVIDLTGSQYGLNEIVCGHRLDLIPDYQGRPGRRPLQRLKVLTEALS